MAVFCLLCLSKILAAWKEAGWQEQLLENRLDINEVRLTLFIPFAESVQTTQETTQETAQETTQEKVLRKTELQKAIIEYLKANPSATRKELAEAISNSTVDGTKYNLGKLQKAGILKRIGSTKSGYWEVSMDLKG